MPKPSLDHASPRVISMALLVSLLAIVSIGPLGCLSRSAGRGDIEAVKYYLSKGHNVDQRDFKKRSALELAIILKRTEMIDLLIAEGANVNRQNKGGRTPLIWASMRFGSTEVINTLIDAGADPNGIDPIGQPALLYSVLYGKPDQTKALVLRGADPDMMMTRKWKASVLSVAIRYKKPSAVQIMVAGGADIEARDARGRNAREQAARLPNVLYAIDRGVDQYNRGEFRAASTLAPRKSETQRPAERPVPRATPPPTPPSKSSPRQLASPVPRRVVQPLPATRVDRTDGIEFGNYYALIIGNDDYQYLPKLRTAVNDAKALSELLKNRYGYRVTTLLNASRAEILKALSRYRRILSAEDNLVIYYAGHGWLDEEEDRGYWLPIDASQDDDVFWIANESITSKTRAIRAKHIMIIADSCYSGKLVRGIHVNTTAPGYLEKLASRRARVVLTSGGVEPVSDAGGRDNHSIFAAALLRALEDNSGVLEGQELFTQIRRPVVVNSDQIPEYSDIRKAGHDGGDFLFVVR
jgi:ankyrin repeat protein